MSNRRKSLLPAAFLGSPRTSGGGVGGQAPDLSRIERRLSKPHASGKGASDPPEVMFGILKILMGRLRACSRREGKKGIFEELSERVRVVKSNIQKFPLASNEERWSIMQNSFTLLSQSHCEFCFEALSVDKSNACPFCWGVKYCCDEHLIDARTDHMTICSTHLEVRKWETEELFNMMVNKDDLATAIEKGKEIISAKEKKEDEALNSVDALKEVYSRSALNRMRDGQLHRELQQLELDRQQFQLIQQAMDTSLDDIIGQGKSLQSAVEKLQKGIDHELKAGRNQAARALEASTADGGTINLPSSKGRSREEDLLLLQKLADYIIRLRQLLAQKNLEMESMVDQAEERDQRLLDSRVKFNQQISQYKEEIYMLKTELEERKNREKLLDEQANKLSMLLDSQNRQALSDGAAVFHAEISRYEILIETLRKKLEQAENSITRLHRQKLLEDRSREESVLRLKEQLRRSHIAPGDADLLGDFEGYVDREVQAGGSNPQDNETQTEYHTFDEKEIQCVAETERVAVQVEIVDEATLRATSPDREERRSDTRPSSIGSRAESIVSILRGATPSLPGSRPISRGEDRSVFLGSNDANHLIDVVRASSPSLRQDSTVLYSQIWRSPSGSEDDLAYAAEQTGVYQSHSVEKRRSGADITFPGIEVHMPEMVDCCIQTDLAGTLVSLLADNYITGERVQEVHKEKREHLLPTFMGMKTQGFSVKPYRRPLRNAPDIGSLVLAMRSTFQQRCEASRKVAHLNWVILRMKFVFRIQEALVMDYIVKKKQPRYMPAFDFVKKRFYMMYQRLLKARKKAILENESYMESFITSCVCLTNMANELASEMSPAKRFLLEFSRLPFSFQAEVMRDIQNYHNFAPEPRTQITLPSARSSLTSVRSAQERPSTPIKKRS